LTGYLFFIKQESSNYPARCFKQITSGQKQSGVFMQRIPITKAGFERLKKDLETIKNVSIPENVRDIEVARAHGDISENAEYSAAKERQSFLYGKVQELENNLALANVISLKGLTNEKVVFGCHVSLEDIDSGEKIKYQCSAPMNPTSVKIKFP